MPDVLPLFQTMATATLPPGSMPLRVFILQRNKVISPLLRLCYMTSTKLGYLNIVFYLGLKIAL